MTGDTADPERAGLRERVPWRRIAGLLGLLLLVVIVVPFVVYSVPQLIGAEHSYVVLSGSMAPAIGPGDVIIVDEVDPESLAVGDVVTFRRDGVSRPTTHRVIGAVRQDGQLLFETKGDAVEDPDNELVPADAIQGRVMSVGGLLIAFPAIGHVIQFAGSHLGFVALFVIPIGLLVILEIRDVIVAARSSADGGGGDDEAQAVDATGGDGTLEESSGGTGGIAFSAAELQLGIMILAAFLAYSVWVSYVVQEMWAYTVTGSVATGLVLLVGLFFTGGDSTDDAGSSTDGAGGPGGGGAPVPGSDPPLGPDDESVFTGSPHDAPAPPSPEAAHGPHEPAAGLGEDTGIDPEEPAVPDGQEADGSAASMEGESDD